MSVTLQPLAIFLLTSLAAAGMLWALFQPRLDGGNRASDRLNAVTGGRAKTFAGGSKSSGRKQSVEDTLRELAEKEIGTNGKKRKVSLRIRIRQAGLGWSRSTFYILSLASGIFIFLIATVAFGIGPLAALGLGLGGALMLPNMYLNQKRKKRIARFVSELPDALDTIVRGVKSGLSLSDCLKAIASEAPEPVRTEFKAIVDDHTMGMPLSEAATRLPDRVPVPEAVFFAIVIAIQSRSGGSLSEALGNLSKVVRERKKMGNKIQAMSSEAKISAMIIGSLPFVITGILAVVSPAYIALLFTNIIGNVILVLSAFWMLIGILVMRKMIAFDF